MDLKARMAKRGLLAKTARMERQARTELREHPALLDLPDRLVPQELLVSAII
jgi:hypothetical protein